MKNQKVKWGVIGCGGIADRRTIPELIKCNNTELIACMDRDESVAITKYLERATISNMTVVFSFINGFETERHYSKCQNSLLRFFRYRNQM